MSCKGRAGASGPEVPGDRWQGEERVGMFRRWIAVFLLSAALFALLSPPAVAREADSPTFQATSSGLPAATVKGQWTEQSPRSFRLELHGGHASGEETTFIARWLTPWTAPGRLPYFQEAYELVSTNEGGEDLELLWSFRFRHKGEDWSRWQKQSESFGGGRSGVTGGSIYSAGGSSAPARFDWRLEGTFTGTATLEGWVTLKVK